MKVGVYQHCTVVYSGKRFRISWSPIQDFPPSRDPYTQYIWFLFSLSGGSLIKVGVCSTVQYCIPVRDLESIGHQFRISLLLVTLTLSMVSILTVRPAIL